MIRVGFVMDFDSDWLGGINYYRNLLNAIYRMPDRRIEAVIFTGTRTVASKFDGFPDVEIIKSDILDRGSLSWFARKVLLRLFSSNFVLERLLIANRIQVLSHSGFLSGKSGIVTIGWMPDFQHLHLPELYSRRRLAAINQDVRLMCTKCSSLVLSSQDALKDLLSMSLSIESKLEVLPFSINPDYLEREPVGFDDLAQRYHFSGKFFFLPNQFWVHKNHKVVIEALAQLKADGHPVLVLATGNTRDSRQFGYFEELMTLAQELDVEDCFRVLGIVPLSDLMMLMKSALAIINPSRFEGWSTTVEEAKLFGKTIVLSDLPVHREQNPEYGYYFNPTDPADLAQRLRDVWEGSSDHGQRLSDTELHDLAVKRYAEFAAKYQKIVMSTLN